MQKEKKKERGLIIQLLAVDQGRGGQGKEERRERTKRREEKVEDRKLSSHQQHYLLPYLVLKYWITLFLVYIFFVWANIIFYPYSPLYFTLLSRHIFSSLCSITLSHTDDSNRLQNDNERNGEATPH